MQLYQRRVIYLTISLRVIIIAVVASNRDDDTAVAVAVAKNQVSKARTPQHFFVFNRHVRRTDGVWCSVV